MRTATVRWSTGAERTQARAALREHSLRHPAGTDWMIARGSDGQILAWIALVPTGVVSVDWVVHQANYPLLRVRVSDARGVRRCVENVAAGRQPGDGGRHAGHRVRA